MTVLVIIAGAGAIGGNDANDSDGDLLRQLGDDGRGDDRNTTLEQHDDPWAPDGRWVGGDGDFGAGGAQGPQDVGRHDGGQPDAPTPEPEPAAETPAGAGEVAEPEWASDVAADGAGGQTVDAFVQGYRDGGGNPSWETYFVNVVIPCESTWNPDAVSWWGHLGLAQFTLRSWTLAGGGDWADPYQQGRNVAMWSSMTEPWTQWGCW